MSEPEPSAMPEKSAAVSAHSDATVAAAAAAAVAGAGATSAGAPSHGFAVYAEKEPAKSARMRPQAVAGGGAQALTGHARGGRAQCEDAVSTSSGEAGGGGICSGGRPSGRTVTRLLIVGWDRVRSYIMIALLLLLVVWAAVFFPLITN